MSILLANAVGRPCQLITGTDTRAPSRRCLHDTSRCDGLAVQLRVCIARTTGNTEHSNTGLCQHTVSLPSPDVYQQGGQLE